MNAQTRHPAQLDGHLMHILKTKQIFKYPFFKLKNILQEIELQITL
jgi:hypothetical protein